MSKMGLLVQLEAKPEQAEALAKLLTEGVGVVNAEAGTLAWFAFRAGPHRFGIFDTFPNDDARRAHLEGRLADALRAKASELLASPPSIESVDVMAEKRT